MKIHKGQNRNLKVNFKNILYADVPITAFAETLTLYHIDQDPTEVRPSKTVACAGRCSTKASKKETSAGRY